MKVIIKVFGKNKETQESEVFELRIYSDNVACLYKDRYGVGITMNNGKFYRVNHTLQELKEIL